MIYDLQLLNTISGADRYGCGSKIRWNTKVHGFWDGFSHLPAARMDWMDWMVIHGTITVLQWVDWCLTKWNVLVDAISMMFNIRWSYMTLNPSAFQFYVCTGYIKSHYISIKSHWNPINIHPPTNIFGRFSWFNSHFRNPFIGGTYHKYIYILFILYIYGLFWRRNFKGYTLKMWLYMIQYLHFRVLKFQLKWFLDVFGWLVEW